MRSPIRRAAVSLFARFVLVDCPVLVACLALVACESAEPPTDGEVKAEANSEAEAISEARGKIESRRREVAAPSKLTPREINRRGDAHLRAGRFTKAIADFDAFLAAEPAAEPHHWQRGIAYYYAGRFKAGVRQFEIHRRVNPDDAENAVWHFLCKAKLDGVDAARKALLPVGPDARVPLMQIYAMFKGETTPEAVARGIGKATATESASSRFYGHLYIGLYHEVMGRLADARHHIAIAAQTRGGSAYMLDIARIHARRLTTSTAK